VKNRKLKDVIKLAESMGFTVDDVATKNHFKLYLTTPKGEKKVLVVSVTASDGRAAKNNEAILKGWKI